MNERNLIEAFYPECHAGGYSRVDGTVQFYSRIQSLVTPSTVLMDFGAGRGAGHASMHRYHRQLRNFKGVAAEVIGADIDPVVTTNPGVERAVVLEPNKPIPLPDGSVDVIVSDNTFEHIEDPQVICNELDRVLAPGGWICARTPNRFGYISLASRAIPEVVHKRVLRKVQPDRKEQDVFPAYYRLNTRSALKRYFPEDRFEHYVYGWDSEPAYHANSRLLYRLLLSVHALTPSAMKTTWLIFLRKKPVAK